MSKDVLGTLDGGKGISRYIGWSKDVQGCPRDMGQEGQGDKASVRTWDGLKMSKDVLGTWDRKDRGIRHQ